MRLYLETSVPNFLFAEDVPDERRHTERLFEDIDRGLHEVWVSGLYHEEVLRARNPVLRANLLMVLDRYRIPSLPITNEVKALMHAYIAQQAFTAASWADAQHVAVAVLNQCERVVSWNFKHIVRDWTMKRVDEVNARLGLQSVVICTPKEVSPQ